MTLSEEQSTLLIERDGSVVKLILNRPEAGNALNMELARALAAAAIQCDTDTSIRCVTLTGRGRLFCAGGDVNEFAAAGAAVGPMLSELAGTMAIAVSRLARMQKPLLCLVNGPVAGAGLSLAILGDVVLAARSAHFTVGYTAIGLTPDCGASWLLPRLVGLRKAQELVLTNRRIHAAEAEAIGLITRAVDEDRLPAEGAAMTEVLDRAATAAVGASRALFLESFGAGLETHMDHEARKISVAGAGVEGQEGIAAFVQKRSPNFIGRVT
jgi:2-(1,2-epoxy-1,2-dihydrophenyl)acetyl-CoA isomerase